MRRRKFITALTAIFTLLAVVMTACKNPPPEHVDVMEILSFETQSKFTLLNLLRSNKVEKAKGMLEMDTFLSLKEIWQVGGDTGILTNRVCNETFREIYPTIRQQIPLSRFHNLPIAERQSLTNFVKAADRIFLDQIPNP